MVVGGLLKYSQMPQGYEYILWTAHILDDCAEYPSLNV